MKRQARKEKTRKSSRLNPCSKADILHPNWLADGLMSLPRSTRPLLLFSLGLWAATNQESAAQIADLDELSGICEPASGLLSTEDRESAGIKPAWIGNDRVLQRRSSQSLWPRDMSKPVQVYILLGQSNMLGFGKIKGGGRLPGTRGEREEAVPLPGRRRRQLDRAQGCPQRARHGERHGRHEGFNNEWMTIKGATSAPRSASGITWGMPPTRR